ncbi:MAG TPA: SAM-dependent methyltransferase [Bryobacteraceae bacterium]|nr:SAM-dependent methyltransferase [Bryobacteraceae bacterium]
MFEPIQLTPIAVVRNSVGEPADDIWGKLVSRIDLDSDRFTAASVAGLGEFSHVEVFFALHKVAESTIELAARHPRGRAEWPSVGIFAQRGRNRPNRIGATVCRLQSVEGVSLWVEGLDAIDGTPILDIKPYFREFGPRGAVLQPDWATQLMAGYWGNAE